MAAPEIPEHLIRLQRAFFDAHDRVVAASAHPGPVADWPAAAVDELHAAREAEVKAALALQDARAEAGFGAYDQQKRVQVAARVGREWVPPNLLTASKSGS